MSARKKSSLSPRISVILCTYNRAHCLPVALEHIASQRVRSFEIVLVDDGSTDGTAAVVAAWRGHTGMRVVSCRHGGVSAARNAGLRVARGRYIAYCDDDCLWRPYHLSSLSAFLDEHPAVGMAYTDMENGTLARRSYTFRDPFDKRRLETLPFIPPYAVMHRADCLLRAGGWDPSIVSVDDWDMFLRFSDQYPIARLARVTGRHICYDHTVATLRSSTRRGKAIVRVLRKRLSRARREGSFGAYAADCSFGVVKFLLNHGQQVFARTLAEACSHEGPNYQTIAAYGLIEIARGKAYRARSLFEQALVMAPGEKGPEDRWHRENVLQVQAHLGVAYFLSGRPVQAERMYRRVLAQDPSHHLARVRLAGCLLSRGDVSQALRLLDHAAANPTAHVVRGACYFRQRRYRRALGEFRMAAILEHDVAFYHYNIGQAYEALCAREEAGAAYRTALSLAPSYRAARQALVRVSVAH